MALIGLLTSLAFAAFFNWAYPNGHEVYWDRAVVAGLCLGVYVVSGFSSVPNKRVYQMSNALFYVFALDVLFTNYLNGFAPLYFISLMLTLQAVTISFRDERQAGTFLLVINAIGMLIMLGIDPSDAGRPWFMTGVLAMSSALLFVIVRIKSRFNRNARTQEDVMRSIVTTTEDMVLLVDIRGIILEANHRCRQMTGYLPEELIGTEVTLLRVNPLSEQETVELLDHLNHHRIFTQECDLRRENGKTFASFITIAKIETAKGRFLVYNVKDWTRRQAFKRSLIRAKEAAEHATALKSQFLATVSHEIRTPLNGIMGMTQVLLETSLDEAQRDQLEHIAESNEHLLMIVNDLLDFSKIEEGRLDLELRPFSPAELAQNTADIFRASAKRKGLTLDVLVPDNLPSGLEGDCLRLWQILLNLIGNAVKFTDQGGVAVELKWNETGTKRGCLELSVSDTGIGIPEDKIDLLFTAFSQVDASHTRRYGGTGLGLAISNRLAGLMRGKIHVQSTPGKGSTFTLNVPLNVTDPVREIQPKSAVAATVPLASPAGPLRILIAEDNRINQEVARLLFRGMGLQPDVVENGKEALEAVRSKHYDVVFMDVQMPVMDGLEATRRILDPQGDVTHKPIIIAMTANAMPEDVRACRAAGMSDFVSKPVRKADLVDAIENCQQRVNNRA